MTNPITASREKIVAEYDEQWPQEIEPVYIPEIRNFINTALLQHEAVLLEHIPVGALRQWINEDLLKPWYKLVTDDDIRAFFKIGTTQPTI